MGFWRDLKEKPVKVNQADGFYGTTVFHTFYKGFVTSILQNVAKTMGSKTIAKKKMLWQVNGGRPHHRSPATATLFLKML